MADTDAATSARRTNLEIPGDLAEEIDALAREDMRTFRPEVVTLLREAVTARKAKRR